MEIDLKVVDADTGVIRFTSQISARSEGKTRCSGDAGLDMGNMLRRAANEAAGKITVAIFPIKILDVGDDGIIFLTQGEGAVSLNQVLEVFLPGRKVIDPDTGGERQLDGTTAGAIRVIEVQNGTAKARVQGPQVVQFQPGMIVRATSQTSGRN